jgi:translation elongation factor P/translation initiation factor 5A
MTFVKASTLKKGDYYIENSQRYRIVEITWLSHGKLPKLMIVGFNDESSQKINTICTVKTLIEI